MVSNNIFWPVTNVMPLSTKLKLIGMVKLQYNHISHQAHKVIFHKTVLSGVTRRVNSLEIKYCMIKTVKTKT